MSRGKDKAYSHLAKKGAVSDVGMGQEFAGDFLRSSGKSFTKRGTRFRPRGVDKIWT